MNKSIFFLFIFALSIFLISKYFFGFNIYNQVLFAQNEVRLYYQKQIEFIDFFINKHLYQEQLIISLSKENEAFKKKDIEFSYIQKEYNSILKLYNLKNPNNTLIKARMISYASISNTSKAWIDFANFNHSKIYGLVYDEFVAGIVSEKNKQAIAIFNKDKLCSYSVVIGRDNILGIMVGGVSKISKNIIIDFIQPWKTIKVGDEVKTSGLDGIFTADIKVGKVIAIEKIKGYKKAIVQPYFDDSVSSKYFYIIDINEK